MLAATVRNEKTKRKNIMYKLTDEQANLIKDILKTIGRDEELNSQFAKAVGMNEDKFDAISDATFIALGNGRVTVVES